MIKTIIAEFIVAVGLVVAGNMVDQVEDPVRCTLHIIDPGGLMACMDK
ncbi:hypothetical protein ACWDOP_31170 [Nocardia sp. NPDC003693]